MAGNSVSVEQQKKISPVQRAQLFAQLTRKNIQPLPAVSANENSTVQFTLTKSRLLHKIQLLVKGTLTLTHASATPGTLAALAPYKFIKNVRVEYNNGFSPFNITGAQLYMYNLMQNNASIIKPVTSTTAATANGYRDRAVVGLESSSGGTANPFRFVVDLPIAINERDPISLYLLQNEEVVVTVTIDFDDADVILSVLTGFTVAMSSLTVTPVATTFSIPPVQNAMPDLGMIKLVSARKESIAGSGTYTMKLTPGNIFRKMAVFIEDANGGDFDGDITGNFEIVLNEADTPIKIPPWVLSADNHLMCGTTLPQGLWLFDLTYQGLANYGGGRDYIDTSKLTEFWFRFPASGAGNVTIVQESLARLQM